MAYVATNWITGDVITATRLNNLETGVKQAHDATIPYGVATGSANTYAVIPSPDNITALTDGMAVAVKINVQNSGASTLNVKGLGAKAIKKPNGNDVSSGNLKADAIYSFRYSSSANAGAGAFILQGEGGSGNAQPSEVLSTKTFTNDAGDQVGTMANKSGTIVAGSWSNTDANTVIEVKIGSGSQGYYDQTTTITFTEPNLLSNLIRAGAIILGVQGNQYVIDTSGLTASAARVLAPFTFAVNGVIGTGTMPDYGGVSVPLRLTSVSGNDLRVIPNINGYVTTQSFIPVTENNWIPNNIVEGITMFGKTGTRRPWNNEKRWATGTQAIQPTGTPNRSLIITGLAFTPTLVMGRMIGRLNASYEKDGMVFIATKGKDGWSGGQLWPGQDGEYGSLSNGPTGNAGSGAFSLVTATWTASGVTVPLHYGNISVEYWVFE